MAITKDSSPVFMEIKPHMAYDKKDKSKVIATKANKMKEWYSSGKFLDYITRDEASLSIDISDKDFADLLVLKREQQEKWEKYKEENNLDPSDKFLTQDELEQKKQFDKPITDKIAELRDSSPSYSGLNMIEYNESGKPFTKKISDDEIQNEYDSFKHLKIDKKQKQIVWTGVVSFSNDFMEKNSPLTPDMINKNLVINLRRMLKKSGWRDNEIKDAKLGWAYHINTDNFHAHFYIYQQHATRFKEELGYKEYIDKYAMSKKSLQDFRMQMDRNLSSDHEELINQRDELRKWAKSVRGNIWQNSKTMYQKLNSEWNIPERNMKQVLTDLKQFQTKNIDEIQKINKGLGSKEVPEAFRQKMLKLSDKVLKDIPAWDRQWNSFLKINKDTAAKKFEKFLLYYKTPMDDKSDVEYSDMDLEIEKINPDDPKLSLSPKDYDAYHKRVLDNIKIKDENKAHKGEEGYEFKKLYQYEDAYEFLKDKKIEFEEKEIYSFNPKGFATGIKMSLSQELLKMMQHPIRIPKGKIPKHIKSPHNYKNLTNKRMTNSQYHLKKALNQIDKRMKKLELEAEKKFKKLNAELEKAHMEETKSWNN